MSTTCELSPRFFVTPAGDAEATVLLREAANIKFTKRVVQFLGHCCQQRSFRAHHRLLSMILENEGQRVCELAWSPSFRRWFQRALKLGSCNDCTPEAAALIRELVGLIVDPAGIQPFLADQQIPLNGGRYSAPDLTWGWQAMDSSADFVSVKQVEAFSNKALTLEDGQSANVWCNGYGGTITRFANIAATTRLTNFDPSLRVKLTGTNQRTSGVDLEAVAWDDYEDAFDEARFRGPFEILLEVWPEEFRDICQIVRVVVPMKFRGRTQAFTVSSHQGAIFLTASDPLQMIEMVVHEKAHVKQRFVDEIWPLLGPNQINKRFAVPWRPDARPIYGIFEGIYVFLQVATALFRLHERGRLSTLERTRRIVEYVRVGLALVEKNAILTSAGIEFFEGIVDACENLSVRLTSLPSFRVGRPSGCATIKV